MDLKNTHKNKSFFVCLFFLLLDITIWNTTMTSCPSSMTSATTWPRRRCGSSLLRSSRGTSRAAKQSGRKRRRASPSTRRTLFKRTRQEKQLRRDRDGSYETFENCTTFSKFTGVRGSRCILTCWRLQVKSPGLEPTSRWKGQKASLSGHMTLHTFNPWWNSWGEKNPFFIITKMHINDCLRPTLEGLFLCPCFNSWRHLALDLGIYRQLIIKDMIKTSTDLALYIHCTLKKKKEKKSTTTFARVARCWDDVTSWTGLAKS